MIVYDQGKSFPMGGVIIGWLFFILGLLIVLGNPLLGFLILLVGAIMAFTKSISAIDTDKQRIKKGASFFGLKLGEWEDYSSFPYISVLRNDVKTSMLSRGSAEAHLKDVFYNISLLNESHRKKILIIKLDDKEKAQLEAKKLSEKLERPLVDFNPVLSRKTQERRERRR